MKLVAPLRFINQAIQKIGIYLPVTIYFILFGLVFWGGFVWLQKQIHTPESSYYDILSLLLRVAFWVITSLLIFSLLTVLLPFLIFSWNRSRKKIRCTVSSSGSMSTETNRQLVKLSVQPILKPFLGFVKFRLYYDERYISSKFSLVENKKKRFFSPLLQGDYKWELPQVKEYNIRRAIVYFEDYFQFFSFVVTIECSGRFHIAPQQQAVNHLNASPRKTEDIQSRIDELKRVEGEYVNYKNFENNDDIRRIVWKIYAKTGDLVIRTPEVLDPYASHVYLFASFHSNRDVRGNKVVEIPFLNYYKSVVWGVYKQLQKQNLDVRFVCDQETGITGFTDEEKNIEYKISTAHWQTENNLLSYINTSEAAVVICSSLNDTHEISQLIDKYGSNIVFVFVSLSKCIRRRHIGDWLKWIFIKRDKSSSEIYRTYWKLSLLRNKISTNEKEMKKLLSQYERSVIV